jgi:hypothetical protein
MKKKGTRPNTVTQRVTRPRARPNTVTQLATAPRARASRGLAMVGPRVMSRKPTSGLTTFAGVDDAFCKELCMSGPEAASVQVASCWQD